MVGVVVLISLLGWWAVLVLPLIIASPWLTNRMNADKPAAGGQAGKNGRTRP